MPHTPGPWSVQQQDPYSPIWIIGPEPESEFLCKMGPNYNANARLIAAAPDLLAACEAFMLCLAPDGTKCAPNAADLKAGRSAIAKAYGNCHD